MQTDGSLWSWGANGQGQLGDGTVARRTAPVHIGTSTWKTVATGDDHTVAIGSDNTMWGWGNNLEGQIGDGTNVNRRVPTAVGTADDVVEGVGGR